MKKRSVFSVVVLFVVLVVSICFGIANATEPWFDGDFRDLKDKLGGWEKPNVVQQSGGIFVVDLTKGPVHILDTDGMTSGASLAFISGASVVTVGKVIIPGSGFPITPISGSGYCPIQYLGSGATVAGTWPFATNVTSSTNSMYILPNVISGLASNGQAGQTAYIADSGVTVF